MEKNLRAGILFLTIVMFWGIIYPQYVLTEDMYQVTENGREVPRDCTADYERILSAKRGEVEIRFALFDRIEEWFGEKNNDEQDRE